MIILCFILLIALGISMIFLKRNNTVIEYRQYILNQLLHCATQDILAGRDWQWRYDAIRMVTYDEMLYKFWRKLDTFYTDLSFLQPGGK